MKKNKKVSFFLCFLPLLTAIAPVTESAAAEGPTRQSEILRLTKEFGISVSGLDNVPSEEVPTSGGDTVHQLAIHLFGLNHLLVHKEDGGIERVIILSPSKTPTSPSLDPGRLAPNLSRRLLRRIFGSESNLVRVSSEYGHRHHPILGYTKLHQGVDLAAPEGTPVGAIEAGTVSHLEQDGGLGLYIRIRHADGLETGYAHMSGLGRGISQGVVVMAGQQIGNVGSTGLSTGPHLHFEVLRQGLKIDPGRSRFAQ